MKLISFRASATSVVVALSAFLSTTALAQAPDSLLLYAPTGVKAYGVYRPDTRDFNVWIMWDDLPDSIGAFISKADTTGWSLATPVSGVSFPTVGGVYNGDIDRTLAFNSIRAGVVGTDSLIITYSIRREEYLAGRVAIGPGYVPGTVIPLTFRDQRTNAPVDFGLNIKFSAGNIDNQGTFIVGLEDFEGFHIWRGIRKDGSDLEVIGELSKEEAFKGRATGGSLADSVYYYDVVPTLRSHQPWISSFGPILNGVCLGARIDLDLNPNQLFWYDCDGTNGFTYYYGVTTFDRGYSPKSGTEGLTKFDNCPVAEGASFPCWNQLVPASLEVTAQSNLYKVYVVPNPVRTGTSRLTTDNYHNFPDGLARFVNLPQKCTIKIYTVSGDLVWINDHVDGTGNVEWDMKNLEDEDVASGVYVYRIDSGSDSVYGRIVVIR